MDFEAAKENQIFAGAEHFQRESVATGDRDYVYSLSNEALFQLPFIAITLLILACDRSKPKVSELGQIVGECFEIAIPGFKGSSQNLGWSANLRIRTVTALTFLEASDLATVNRSTQRLQASPLGRNLIHQVIKQDDDLSNALSKLKREYRNLRVKRQIRMEAE